MEIKIINYKIIVVRLLPHLYDSIILSKKNLIKTDNIIIDSKSGYSGAGRGIIKNIEIKIFRAL